MNNFKKYRRIEVVEMIPVIDYKIEVDSNEVYISDEDNNLDWIEFNQGYVAHILSDHDYKWYVSKKCFDENFEECI